MDKVLDFMKDKDSLHRLNLTHNKISDDGAKAIAAFYQDSKHKWPLFPPDFSDNQIGNDGAKALASINISGIGMELVHNNIAKEGAMTLAEKHSHTP